LPVAKASAQGRIKIAGLIRKTTAIGETDVCGKLHISSPYAVTPQQSDPPKDIVPEDALKMIGIRVAMGRSQSNEPLPLAFHNGAIPTTDACEIAFTRGITSFLPFAHTLPPRSNIPGDEEKHYASECIDNFFNKAVGGWTSAIMGMALYYKEEINKQRRQPIENDVVSECSTGADILTTQQRRALESKSRESQILSFLKPLILPFVGGEPSLTAPSFSPSSPLPLVEDSLRALPPPPQPAVSVVPDPTLARGNPSPRLRPLSIVNARDGTSQTPNPQVFTRGGRERHQQGRSSRGRGNRSQTFSLGPPPRSSRY
jgi:hypothetical protein